MLFMMVRVIGSCGCFVRLIDVIVRFVRLFGEVSSCVWFVWLVGLCDGS